MVQRLRFSINVQCCVIMAKKRRCTIAGITVLHIFRGDDRIAQCFAKYYWVQINELLGLSGLGKVYLVL